MVKRMGYIFLAFALAITMITGCAKKGEVSKENKQAETSGREMVENMYKTGLPIVKDKVTLKVAVTKGPLHGPYSEMALMKEMEEKTNVHIEWIEYAIDGIAEKVNIMLASGDYPDMAWKLNISDKNMLTYGKSGAILKLNDLINNYAPNWVKVFKDYPYAKKVATASDGNIYSLPFVRVDEANSGIRDAWIINKTWLDKLNLKMPTTTDEFHQVLKAFKEKDPNGNGKADEIPWSFRFDGYTNGQFDIFGSFDILYGAYGNPYIGVKNSKVFFTATQPEVKEALKYLNTLYQEGLIDKESFTQNLSQYQAKCKASPEILGTTSVYHGVSEFGNERMEKEVYVAMPPLKGPSGAKPVWRQQTSTVIRGFGTIFSTNKYPEITMRWANELADEKNSMQGFYGIIGKHIKEAAGGKYDIVSDIYPDRGKDVPLNFGPFAVTPDVVSKINRLGSDALRLKFYNIYKPYVAPLEDIYPDVFFTQEQLDILAKYETDLKSFVKQTQSKWIVEGGIDSGWDAFVKKVNELKVDEVLKVYQQGLDTFNKN